NGVLYALDSDNGLMAWTLATATTNPLPPAFYLNPATKLAVAGEPATLTSGADSSLPINYQWYYFATNTLAGATNQTLTLSNAQPSQSGSYSVVASNSLGSATSAVAVLTIVATPPNSLITYESFPYNVGSLIGGQGGWFTSASFGTVTNGNLSISGLAPSLSNSVASGSRTVRMRKNIGTNNNRTLYFSFPYPIHN